MSRPGHGPDLVILTGAGLSAESGLGTFREKDGLWTRYDLNDVATPEGFARDPELVRDFYNARRANLREAEPNDAHRALARLQRTCPGQVMIVTQNVDDLLERAGAEALHMHGELFKTRCAFCEAVRADKGDLTAGEACPSCGEAGGARPDVVWFGEIPMFMPQIEAALEHCRFFASIGTSGAVWPAGGFAAQARRAGARIVELNLEATEISEIFHETIRGPASEILPPWGEEMEGRLARSPWGC